MSKDQWGEERSGEAPASASDNSQPSGKEWRLIEQTLAGLVTEKRAARRWGILFKSLTFIYLFALLVIMLLPSIKPVLKSTGPHVAVVRVDGVIGAGKKASADNLIKALQAAYKDDGTKAVLLSINSPGGSPVQAGQVYDEIKRQQKLHPDIKVYAVISDIGASGAYYIAAAADEIYADKASLVGSIGVVSPSFGFVDLMKKLGVERRLLTSGDHKGMLDPFSPLKPEEKQFWQSVLDTTHKQFIDEVKKGRGDRLKITPDLFSGLVWSGEQAEKLGLIDGLGSRDSVARDVIHQTKFKDYTVTTSALDRLVNRLGTSMAQGLVNELGLSPEARLR